MGIAKMAQLAHDRQDQEAAPTPKSTLGGARGLESFSEATPGVPAGGGAPGPSGGGAVQSALERLTSFVPTEVIAGWAAAVGLIAPGTKEGHWVIYGGAMVLIVVLVVIELAVRDKKNQRTTPFLRRVLMVVVATSAFTVWAFASPGSPAAAEWGDQYMRYFGVVAIALSAVLYRLNQLLGLAPID